MIAKDAVRFGASVEAGGRVLTPVVRVRYTVVGMAGFGAVEPLGFVLEEDGETSYYSFDLLRGWDWVRARLEGC